MVNFLSLLILSLILFFLGGWLIPITDPTESVYVLTAKEMLAAGEWLSPRIYGDFWFDKPIMFYWELLIAYKIFGVNEFAARFFPAVFATLGVFMTYFFGAKLYNRKVGFVAAVMLATSLEYWYLAHAIITDMTLLVLFSLTLMSFFLGYRAGEPRLYLIAFGASGLAVLTKGPIGFFLPGLIILIFLAWQGDLRHLKKLFRARNLLLFAAVVAVWYVPMTFIHGAEFLENFLGVHNFLRATVSEYPKTDVWYYYLLITTIGFLPWSIPMIWGAIKKLRRVPTFDMTEKFLIVWTLTVIIFFQLCATKYITYTLPAMLSAMIFFARFFVRHWKVFVGIAVGSLIIYPLIQIFVALPLTEDNSSRREAEIILPLLDGESCAVSHGKDYAGSLVFYTGEKIYRLETKENFEKLRPQKMTWTSKNVMPFMTFDELPTDKKVVAVVSVDYSKSFLDNAAGRWELVGEVEQGELESLAEKFFYGRERRDLKSK
ncbi:MAG: glycosyltransferase family 39 protein, partial [Selenomonadaceae bacterium]|nr:glycosyltransferase family 39 protein [Selenomonadaceae bacterium]